MSVRNVVNDALHDALGYADNTVVDFIVSLSARAASVDAFAFQLECQGLPASAAQALAEKLVVKKAPAPVKAVAPKYDLIIEKEEEEEVSKKRTRKKDKTEVLQAQETDAEKDRRERDEFAERMALNKMSEAAAKAEHVPRAARLAMEEAAKRKQVS
jgi:hypothetical protein